MTGTSNRDMDVFAEGREGLVRHNTEASRGL